MPYESITFEGKKFSINYTRKGTSPNVLFFIHGLGCSEESFSDLWNYPWIKDYTIITFDLPGCGKSSKPKDFSYSIFDHAEICRQILEKLTSKKSKVHIIGHSMGGAIGLLLSKNIPNLTSYVSIEGSVFSEDLSISKKVVRFPFKKFKDYVFEVIQKSTRTSPEKGTRLWAEWSMHASPEAVYKGAESLVQISSDETLLKLFLGLLCPNIYFYGGNGTRKAIFSIKEIQKIKIPDAGHFVMNDNPDEFYGALHTFLRKDK